MDRNRLNDYFRMECLINLKWSYFVSIHPLKAIMVKNRKESSGSSVGSSVQKFPKIPIKIRHCIDLIKYSEFFSFFFTFTEVTTLPSSSGVHLENVDTLSDMFEGE